MTKQNFSRDRLGKIGIDTAKAIMRESYIVGTEHINIENDIELMLKGTEYYRYKLGKRLENVGKDKKPTFVVSTKDTVTAVEDQVLEFGSSCCLNFASAKHPGGGFLTGAMAQEEAICYRTTLYGSLKSKEDAYKYSLDHLNNGLYSTWAIYSPNVNIIRDSEMNFIANGVKFSAITCPAPNRKVYKGSVKDINQALYDRCKLIIEIAAYHGEKNLVLGAFGCGVFKNDPKDVADIFYRILVEEEMMYYFDNIEFAVLGNGMDINFRSFNKRFK